MSVNKFINGELKMVAGLTSGSGSCDCDEKIFTGTAAEYEAQKDIIEDGTIINIIDDLEDGTLIDVEVLNRVSDLEEDVENIKTNNGNIQYLTQEQYNALPDDKLTNGIEYRITDANASESIASNLAYDNTHSGIEAVNVQGAIDKLSDSLGTLFIRKTVSKKITVPASGSNRATTEITTTEPNGYTLISITPISLTQYLDVSIHMTGSTYHIKAINTTSTEVSDATVAAYFTYVKTDCISLE